MSADTPDGRGARGRATYARNLELPEPDVQDPMTSRAGALFTEEAYPLRRRAGVARAGHHGPRPEHRRRRRPGRPARRGRPVGAVPRTGASQRRDRRWSGDSHGAPRLVRRAAGRLPRRRGRPAHACAERGGPPPSVTRPVGPCGATTARPVAERWRAQVLVLAVSALAPELLSAHDRQRDGCGDGPGLVAPADRVGEAGRRTPRRQASRRRSATAAATIGTTA